VLVLLVWSLKGGVFDLLLAYSVLSLFLYHEAVELLILSQIVKKSVHQKHELTLFSQLSIVLSCQWLHRHWKILQVHAIMLSPFSGCKIIKKFLWLTWAKLEACDLHQSLEVVGNDHWFSLIVVGCKVEDVVPNLYGQICILPCFQQNVFVSQIARPRVKIFKNQAFRAIHFSRILPFLFLPNNGPLLGILNKPRRHRLRQQLLEFFLIDELLCLH